MTLIESLIEKYHKPLILQKCTGRCKLLVPYGHFPDLVPATAKKTNATWTCVECKANGKRKESRYQCKSCCVCSFVFRIISHQKMFYSKNKLTRNIRNKLTIWESLNI